MRAKIVNITRCSLNDGPGIRTAVYFKGCNLSCKWCHNPETISLKTEIMFYPSRCVRCGRCVTLCPEHHIVSEDGATMYIRENCSICLRCAEACPNGALAVCGKDMTAEELFAEIIKDKKYYDISGGGVTFSGGECLLKLDFLMEALKLCRKDGIRTAVETTFCVQWDIINTVREYIHLFIIDIKHYDDETHRLLTGRGNRLVLQNVERLSHLHPDILIRIPLIPGANDDDKNLMETAKLISSFGGGIHTVELLKYNNMAGNKYKALGKKAVFFLDGPQEDSVMERKRALVEENIGNNIKVVCG